MYIDSKEVRPLSNKPPVCDTKKICTSEANKPTNDQAYYLMHASQQPWPRIVLQLIFHDGG